MRIEDGVRMSGDMAMMHASMVVQEVCRAGEFDATLIGGTEGRRPDTPHSRGLALDYRADHISDDDRLWFADHVRARLGDGYDVALHGEGSDVRLQVEYDPKD